MRFLIACLAVAWPATAFAHAADHEPFALRLTLAGLLLLGAMGYGVGVHRLWRAAGVGRGIRRADVARFVAGWSALAAALLSPIDALAERSFAMHMIQHELLMVVAAPLLVLSRPGEAWAWALAAPVVRVIGVAFSAAWIGRAWRTLKAPTGAWTAHALAVWTWHAPKFFAAALASTSLHVLEHSCFLASALLFWGAVFSARSRVFPAASLAMAFTTMLHTSALGLLLTFAPTAFYGSGDVPALGLSALEDQQLGGLVMWVPGALPYLIAGLVIVHGWLAGPHRTQFLQRPTCRPSSPES